MQLPRLAALLVLASPLTTPSFAQAPGDTCATAIPVLDGTYDSTTFAPEDPISDTCAGFSEDIWYSYTACCAGTLQIDVNSASGAIWLRVHSSGCTSASYLDNDCVTSQSLPVAAGQTVSFEFCSTQTAPPRNSPVTFNFTVGNSCTVHVSSAEISRIGTPPNPNVLLPGQTSGPVVGEIWDPLIDHTSFAPGAIADILAVTPGATNLPLPPYGTLLCDAFSFPPYQFPGVPGLPFSVPIPLSCSLVGGGLCAQGVSIDGGGSILLTNALDILVGSI